MKKNIYKLLSVSISGLLLMVSCQNEVEVAPFASEISIDVTEIMTFAEKDAEPKNVKVTSDGEWVIINSSSWLEITPRFGKGNTTVSIVPKDNLEASSDGKEQVAAAQRRARVVFCADSEQAVLNILQSGDETKNKEVTYKKATAVTAGKKYIIVSKGLAPQANTTSNYAKLTGIDAYPFPDGNIIMSDGNNSLIFTEYVVNTVAETDETTVSYTIQQAADDRYLQNEGKYSTFNFKKSVPDNPKGYLWSVVFDSDGKVEIQNLSTEKYIQNTGAAFEMMTKSQKLEL